MNDLGEILYCVLLLVKRHGNESGGKKAISNFTVYLVLLLIFHFSFNWKQYIIPSVLYTLSIISIMMVLGVLTKKYGGRIRRFIRDVWISYLEQQQQWNDIEMDRTERTQPPSHGCDHHAPLQ